MKIANEQFEVIRETSLILIHPIGSLFSSIFSLYGKKIVKIAETKLRRKIDSLLFII